MTWVRQLFSVSKIKLEKWLQAFGHVLTNATFEELVTAVVRTNQGGRALIAFLKKNKVRKLI